MILTVDTGVNFGYAYWTLDGELVEYGTLTVSSAKQSTIYERIGEMANQIKRLFMDKDMGTPSTVVVEDVNVVRMRSRDASRWRAATWGTIVSLASTKGVPVIEYPPTKIKKSVTGNGRATKPLVIRKVREELSIKSKINDHEADAIAVGLHYFKCTPANIGDK